MCEGCNKMLSEQEVMLNSVEDFIANKCLCRDCLSVSNEEIRSNNEEP